MCVQTGRSGLRDFMCLGRMPMHSTGGERFTVYVYFRTFRYFNGIEKAWEQYDDEDEEEDEEEDGEKSINSAKCDAEEDDDESGPLLLKSSK